MKTSLVRYLFCAASAIAGMCCADARAAAEENQFSVGVEGFYDTYQEPTATVNSKAYYGAITGNYTHNWNAFFAALDGRVSYGEEDYESVSGTSSGTPQWELEGRVRGGYSFSVAQGWLSPYIGIGTRYYRDEGKGVVTNLGFFGYDRRITQIYLPVGFTYSHILSGNWTIAPNLEYDQLLWGQVSTRLATFPNNFNVINHQDRGWGLRGNIMLGWSDNGGATAFQAGPFFRYWNISDSDFSVADTAGNQGLEPHNTRLQTGVEIRYLW